MYKGNSFIPLEDGSDIINFIEGTDFFNSKILRAIARGENKLKSIRQSRYPGRPDLITEVIYKEPSFQGLLILSSDIDYTNNEVGTDIKYFEKSFLKESL